MRKTTEELANAAVSELNDDAFDFNGLGASDKEMLLHWFETFRRLVIENERECAEVVAWLTDREAMYFDKEDARRDCDGFIQPLFTFPPATHQKCPVCGQGKLYCNACGTGITFPPAAQVQEGWKLVPIEPTEGMIVAGWHEYDCNPEHSLRHWYKAMLAAAPEVKHGTI